MDKIAYERYANCRFAEGAYGRRQAEAAALLEGALHGDTRDRNRLFEALTTSDTPVLLAPALNRRIIDGYERSYDKMWSKIASKEITDDFRANEISKYEFNQKGIPASNGGQTFIPGTLPRVAEGDEYPTIAVTATGLSWKIAKSGEQFALTWERIVNNRDLSELERALNIFGVHSAQTEDVEATRQFMVATDGGGVGVLNALPTDNLLGGTGTGALTYANLYAAITQARAMKVNGRTINPRGGFNLIVDPSQVMVVEEILSKDTIRTGTDPQFEGPNLLRGKFTIVEDEWLSALDPTNGATTWAIAPKPGSLGEAEGISVGFLRGHESPELSVKSSDRFGPNGERIPGVSGDFDHDSFATRVRHTATGITKTFSGWVASNGSA